MENTFLTKKVIIYICIAIVVIIIFRIIYNTFKTNVEGFNINNNTATDLLSKLKSTSVLEYDSTSQSSNTEQSIRSWNNKIYNMMNSTQLEKPIALYKPILTIDNIQYSKLGDIISQNTDYSPPNSNQFSILVKKKSSDIKPPVSFDLMVDIGDSDFDSTYYSYANYINNTVNISDISTNLINCTAAFTNLNSLINNNLPTIKTQFQNFIYKTQPIYIDNSPKIITRLLNNSRTGTATTAPVSIAQFDNINEGFTNKNNTNIDKQNKILKEKFSSWDGFKQFLSSDNQVGQAFTRLGTPGSPDSPPPKPTFSPTAINSTITSNSTISLPAGCIGYILDSNNQSTNIDIPSTLDSAQDENKINLVHKLPLTPYGTLTVENIDYNRPSSPIFNLIPIFDILNYIKELCTDIKAIYINQSKNTNLLTYLKLTKSSDDVDNVLSVLNSYSSTDPDILLTDVLANISTQNVSITDTTTLLNLVLYIISNMTLRYKLTMLKFTPNQIKITTATDISITNFNNDIISNIPNTAYRITSNSSYFRSINQIIPSVTSFSNFIRDFSNKTINYFPLQIYKPIAPDGYTSLGHVFCNVDSDLQKIKSSENVACIPSNCVKEIRDWRPNDKIFEYNKNGVYWAIFFNPYTGTFISTNTNAQQLPLGKVCKVVACVAKCTAVDTLEKADDCTRKYYNLNKKLTQSTPVTSTLVSDQEEVFYLDKIKAQSDSITRLKNKAQTMQTSIEKATIVNREMNKNKLQNYVDTQKANIDTVMNRLENDKNKIQTNVKIPLSVINEIIKILKNPDIVDPKISKPIIEAIIKNQTLSNNNIITDSEYNASLNNILRSCPQYDFTDLVSKAKASDVCYGCDIPR
jgi:hypothetical protein